MPIANIFAMAVGLIIAAVGAMGIVSPSVLLEFARSMLSTGGLWVLALIRVVFGAILIWASPNSRTPRILLVLGILIIIAGLATPFFGVERSRAMFEWWSGQGSLLARTWPMLAIGFGLYVAYVVTPSS